MEVAGEWQRVTFSGRSRWDVLVRIKVVLVVTLVSCQRAKPPVPAPVSDNTYLDVLAGWRIRVVAPVLKDPSQPVVSANVKGVETQYYALRGSRRQVRVKFLRATVTIDGKTEDEPQPLKNYFPLPAGALEVRLIYLARSTEAPHDMAVVFARRSSLLEELSKQVIHDPHSCDAAPSGCLWIPVAVAAIAEHRQSPADLNSWQPVR